MEEDEDFFSDAPFSNRPIAKFNIAAPKDGEQKPVVVKSGAKDLTLLEPNHPLLEKFQKTLNQFLVKQLTDLSEDVLELESGAKKKCMEREAIGVESYDIQQIITRQQTELDIAISELNNTSGAHEELENKLTDIKGSHKHEKDHLCSTEMKEVELRKEVDSMNLLVHQMSQWECDTESDLIVNQRISEKTKKDKMRLADEKRAQDMHVYKLMSEVWRLEGEMETMLMQLRVKEEERDKLAEAVTLSNIDIEANQAEYRCLINGWQSIIVGISNRDKRYNSIMNDYKTLNEKVTEINCETAQTKKQCSVEMMKNESLTLFKSRIEADIKNTQKLLDQETEKRNNLDHQMMINQAILEQLEKDFARVQAENHRTDMELNGVVREFEKKCTAKILLEEQILSCMQDQITNNKAAQFLNKQVRDVTGKNRDFELTLAHLENSNAKVTKDIENQRYENIEIGKQWEDVMHRINLVEAEVEQCTVDTNKCMMDINKKQRYIDILTKRVEKLNHLTTTSNLSPLDLKILDFERQIEMTQTKNKEMQSYWIREQQIVVDLAVERQDLIKDINLLKKQIMILDQKNLKITDEMDKYRRDEERMDRSIICLRNKLTMFTEYLNKKRGSKESLSGGNSFAQIEFTEKLERAEMETLKLEADIAEIETDKLNLSKLLIDKNRDGLCWEKKIQMATETKKNMLAERGESGDVGKMKLEIHRMQVRYTQLKKAQDKLSHDLEHCVYRRESIVIVSKAREKKAKNGIDIVRIHVQKKMDDIRNRIKQTEHEEVNMEQRIEMKKYEVERTLEEMRISEEDTDNLRKVVDQHAEDINKTKTEKQFNLDILLSKQRKLKVYSELSRGRLPFTLYKTASSVSLAYEKEKQINSQLQIVIDNLLIDFPTHFHVLTRAYNTLKIPTLYL